MFVQLNKSESLTEFQDALIDISPVKYYILGPDLPDAIGNYWAESDTYPPYETKPFELFLSSNDRLEQSDTDTTSGTVTYSYDPADPVPTTGGNTIYSIPCGPRDQTPLYTRKDIVSFNSDPFPDGLFICGKLSVNLYVSSDAIDTDFTAKLVDVYPDPDNRNMLIQDGIIRMRWRDSRTTPSLMIIGTVYPITVDLWSICYVLNPGHALRLDISSSNYPRFDVNPNTGLPINETSVNVTATNNVYFGGTYPSKIIIDKPIDQSILKPVVVQPEPEPEPGSDPGTEPEPKPDDSSAMSLIINVCLMMVMVVIVCLLS